MCAESNRAIKSFPKFTHWTVGSESDDARFKIIASVGVSSPSSTSQRQLVHENVTAVNKLPQLGIGFAGAVSSHLSAIQFSRSEPA